MAKIERGITRRRLTALVLLLTYLPACSTWRVENVPPAQLVQSEAPSEVRITRADSSTLVLGFPRVVGDSLLGRAGGAQLGIPVTDVRAIATRHGDAGKTALLALGVLGAVIAVAVVADCTSSEPYVC
jgi:hypothetical protein